MPSTPLEPGTQPGEADARQPPGPGTLHAMRAAIAAADADVLVDFDHTLFASNSTELFLASARPRFLASIVLGLVRGAFPWYRYSSRYGRLRDYASVLAVMAAMPWTLLAWRRAGPALFRRHGAHPLAVMLREVPASRIVIVSFGLVPLVRALVRGSHFEACRLVAVPVPCRPRLLVSGKVALVGRHRPPIDHARAVFITDSEDDRDLLDAVASGYLIPRQGERVLADARLYLPWRYASLGKYGRGWTLDLVLHVDLVLVLLATTVVASASLWLMLAALLLFTSLHAVYEIGYFENDFRAAATEAEPTLDAGAELFRGFPLERHAWLWAGTLGLLGCLALCRSGGAGPSVLAPLCLRWAAVLAVTRGVFALYNRSGVSRRLLLYPLLQAAKSFGLLAVLPASLLGVALLSSQVLAMWMNYAVYRLSGLKGVVPREEVRLAVFVTLGLGIVLARPAALAETGPLTLACMLGWLAWRVARHRIQVRRARSAKPPGAAASRVVRSR